ncbi:MAG: S8 family serine peptidase [Anaerolineae bacterium]
MDSNLHGHRDRIVGRGLIALAALTLLFGNAQSMGAPIPQQDQPFQTISLPPEALTGHRDFIDQPARDSRNPKLDSTLGDLAGAGDAAAKGALIKSRSLRMSGDQVHVQIVTDGDSLQGAIEAVHGAGGEVTKTSRDGNLIQGWLPIDKLEVVAAHDDIHLIRRPAEAILLEVERTGSQTTEGLTVINGEAWHGAGYRGAGVKIGVIDGGFLGYAGLLSSDLPPSVDVKNFVDGESDAQVNGTTEHGTACAEIIHDIAPEASLYLAKVNTNLDLAEAVAWLKDTHQVDIISTSMGWFNLTPGDGTGQFEDLVQEARDAGILWLTAAGNDREAHWGGPFNNPSYTADDDNTHYFSLTQNVNYFGPGDEWTAYLIRAGWPINVYLRWDDWTDVDQDYDLYLFRLDGAAWVQVAASENDQSGGYPWPTEQISYVTDQEAAYGFQIVRYDSDRDVNLEVFAPKVARLEYLLHARSLENLADAPSAVTVAALDVSSPYPQEVYSSEGPTNGSGGTASGGFTKPDIAAFANVNTVSYGTEEGSKFNGTSSATPHVAGAAALVLSAHPSYPPDQLQSFLEDRAVDMGGAGMDDIYGHGRLYLGEPPSTIPGPDDTVAALAVQADGRILIGGYFTQVNGVERNHIARLNADGSLDTSFNPSANGRVDALAVQPDGKILVGGAFNQMSGEARNRIARLDSDGNLDTAFDPGADAYINAMVVQPDGKILVAGPFTELDGVTIQRLARLDPDGTLDASFNPDANDVVWTLAVQADGKILIGGRFSEVNGRTRERIARLHPDGSVDEYFKPDVVGVSVMALAVQADGGILMGGTFKEVNETKQIGIARLSPDGDLDGDFLPDVVGDYVSTLAVQVDGKILVGGQFTEIGGGSSNNIGRLESNGKLDIDFDLDASGSGSYVLALAMEADGRILVGGCFTEVNGHPHNYFARISNNTAAGQTLSVYPNGQGITWLRGGASPEVWRVTFELSTDGIHYTPLGGATRIEGGWRLTGLSLPDGQNLWIRARGYGGTGKFNGSGSVLEAVLNTILVTAPAITSDDNTTFTVGEVGTFTITATGIPTPAISGTGELPSGVTFTDNGDATAILSGTPDAGTDGVWPLTLEASNGVDPHATQSFTLTVEDAEQDEMSSVFLPLVSR